MRYADIKHFDTANGDGVRVSLWTQGCNLHCLGCHNADIWDYNGGKEFDKAAFAELLHALSPDFISGLSILGGEPLSEENMDILPHLVRIVKLSRPDKDIWLWTGKVIDEVPECIKKYVDVIIDGRFIQSLKQVNLPYRGSTNQHLYRKFGERWVREL